MFQLKSTLFLILFSFFYNFCESVVFYVKSFVNTILEVKKYIKKNWQLPIFAYTIVGVKVLNFCVRYGNRCIHFAIVTNLILEK